MEAERAVEEAGVTRPRLPPAELTTKATDVVAAEDATEDEAVERDCVDDDTPPDKAKDTSELPDKAKDTSEDGGQGARHGAARRR